MLFAVCFKRGAFFDNVLAEVTRTRSVRTGDVIDRAIATSTCMTIADLVGVYCLNRKEQIDSRTLVVLP